MKKLLIISTILMGFVVSGWSQRNENITLPEKPKRAKYVDYSTKQTGYWLAAQVGAGFSTIPSVYAQFDFVNGYRFSEFLKVGIGISPKVGTNGTSSIPVYAEVRGNIISQEDTMFAFYWNADIGYAINGGIYVSPGIGVKFGGIRHNFLTGIYCTLEGQKDDFTSFMMGFRIGYEF